MQWMKQSWKKQLTKHAGTGCFNDGFYANTANGMHVQGP